MFDGRHTLPNDSYETLLAYCREWWEDPEECPTLLVPIYDFERQANIIRRIFALHYGVERVKIDKHLTFDHAMRGVCGLVIYGVQLPRPQETCRFNQNTVLLTGDPYGEEPY